MDGRGWIVLAALGVVLAGAPAARANTPRYASVGGSGSDCTAAAPCGLQAAVNGTPPNLVQAHDEVIVEPGTYGSSGAPTAALQDQAGFPLTIHGQAGSPRPVIFANSFSAAITLVDPGSTLSHLEFDQLGTGGHAIDLMAGSASDIVANALTTNGVACGVLGTLQDAICAATGNGGAGVEAAAAAGSATFTPKLRDVTAWSLGASSAGIRGVPGAGTAINMTVTNTIAHGTTDVDGGSATIALDHSDYATKSGTAVTAPGTATNVAAPALLVNPAAGDFHEQVGSPTVDAGAPDTAVTDIYGGPRTLGAATDIGAAELAPAPLAAATGAIKITDTTATLTGIVNPQGLETTFHFLFGTTQGTGSSTGSSSAGAVAAGHAVTMPVAKLRPETTYFVRLVATNAGGTTVSPLAGFKTLASFKGLTIRSSRVRPSKIHKVMIAVACPKGTPTHCTGTLSLTLGGHSAGRAHFNVKPGKSGHVTIKLAARAQTVLAKRTPIKLRATAKAKNGLGRAKTTKRTVTVVR
jgi:hypothetical protein